MGKHRALRGTAGLLAMWMAAGLYGQQRGGERPPDPAVQEVRKSIEAAQKEISQFRDGGGKNDDPNHPAVKWLGTLWQYRQTYPGSEAAGLASAEALHLLFHADRVDEVLTRMDALDVNDTAWERLPSVLNEIATARKDPSVLTKRLERVASESTSAKIRASAFAAWGRAYRESDPARARTLLERAASEAPGSPAAREADNLLYELASLSVGKPAPAFAAKAWKGKAISLEGYKNQALVLVFWSST